MNELGEAVAKSSDSTPGGILSELALASLPDKLTAKVRKALLTYLVLSTGYRVAKKYWDKARAEVTYNVSVPGDDEIYDDVHDWLLSLIPPSKRRAMVARSTSSGHVSSGPTWTLLASDGADEAEEATSDHETRTEAEPDYLRMFYDGTRAQTVDIEGHKIKVEIERDTAGATAGASASLGRDPSSWMLMYQRIVFTARGADARGAIVRLLGEIARERHHTERTPAVRVAARWGDWQKRDDLPTRSMETIVTAPGLKEGIVEDLSAFFADEEQYGRLGIPWHRGYLLHGPPGTGKTSLARALATLFKMDLYYMPIGSIDEDVNLLMLVSNVKARSLLLLEDIDVLQQARDRDTAGPSEGGVQRLTLSGILNVLDGVATPHGLVTVMTTNRRDVLDEALLRPGRVDLDVEFGHVDDEQVRDLFALFYDEPTLLTPELSHVPEGTVAAGQVTEVLKTSKTRGQAAAALANLKPVADHQRLERTKGA